MKMRLKKTLGILCLLLFITTASAENLNSKCPCRPRPPGTNVREKTYLNNSDIEISQNKILVKIQGKVEPAIALFSDEDGLYILTKKRQGRCPEEYWECSTCGGCSPWYVPECDWCGCD